MFMFMFRSSHKLCRRVSAACTAWDGDAAHGRPPWPCDGKPWGNHRKTIGKWWFNGIYGI